jgi:(S)-3,5-dihydroxyphenylglycine transaminase
VIHLGSFSDPSPARVGFAVADQTVTDSAGYTGLLADSLPRSRHGDREHAAAEQAVSRACCSPARAGSELNTQQAAYYAHAMRSTLRQLDLCFRPKRGYWGCAGAGPTEFFLTMRVPFRQMCRARRRRTSG